MTRVIDSLWLGVSLARAWNVYAFVGSATNSPVAGASPACIAEAERARNAHLIIQAAATLIPALLILGAIASIRKGRRARGVLLIGAAIFVWFALSDMGRSIVHMPPLFQPVVCG